MMSTRVQTWEFKGGYKRRYIDLSLDQAGNSTQAQRSQDVPVPQRLGRPGHHTLCRGLAGALLELRVAQVTPDNAPFVVASVGGLPEIENNIMVPTVRSIVRNVVGAQGRHVLDLADNRAALEHAVEDAIRPEGLRAGIVAKEVKFGDPALPPELLVSRGFASKWPINSRSPTSRSRRRKRNGSKPKRRERQRNNNGGSLRR